MIIVFMLSAAYCDHILEQGWATLLASRATLETNWVSAGQCMRPAGRKLPKPVLESPFYYVVVECNVFGNLIKYILSKIDHIKTAFGLIHTRHFRSQYCDKKIFFSSKYCSYISKSFQINRKKYFQFTQ